MLAAVALDVAVSAMANRIEQVERLIGPASRGGSRSWSTSIDFPYLGHSGDTRSTPLFVVTPADDHCIRLR
jgi:hypothetical protein